MSVRSFLKKITGNVLDHYPELREASTWNEHVAAGLRLELKACPLCSGPFKDHRYARVASIRIGKGNPSPDAFVDYLKRRDWNTVITYQSGQEMPDNAEACVVACSQGGLALLLVHTPFEPWDYASIDFCEVLKPTEGEDLKKLVSVGSWIPLEKSN